MECLLCKKGVKYGSDDWVHLVRDDELIGTFEEIDKPICSQCQRLFKDDSYVLCGCGG